jgi:hypothetical protein
MEVLVLIQLLRQLQQLAVVMAVAQLLPQLEDLEVVEAVAAMVPLVEVALLVKVTPEEKILLQTIIMVVEAVVPEELVEM